VTPRDLDGNASEQHRPVTASHRSFAKVSVTAATTPEGVVSFTIAPTAKAPKSGRLTLTVAARTPAGAPGRRLVSFRLRP